MTPVKLSGRGHILEWTRVHRPAPGYEFQVPYALALVQTEEGPLVTGQVVDSDPADVRCGAAVHSVFRRLGADGDSGVIYYGTKWQIAPGAPAAKELAEPKPTKKRRLGRKK